MTEEQKTNIRKDIERTIYALARSNGVHNDEVIEVFIEITNAKKQVEK